MKSIRLYIILFLFGLLTGCFEDEGHYYGLIILIQVLLNVCLVMREMVKS